MEATIEKPEALECEARPTDAENGECATRVDESVPDVPEDACENPEANETDGMSNSGDAPEGGQESAKESSRARKRMARNKELGRKGEEAAARFLYNRGYEILERNWQCFAGEADIIARDGDTLVFVEVKTRKNCDKGFPSEHVDAKKREKYEKIALSYAADYSRVDIPVRFDVVAIVVVAPDKAMIRHDINAYSVM